MRTDKDIEKVIIENDALTKFVLAVSEQMSALSKECMDKERSTDVACGYGVMLAQRLMLTAAKVDIKGKINGVV